MGDFWQITVTLSKHIYILKLKSMKEQSTTRIHDKSTEKENAAHTHNIHRNEAKDNNAGTINVGIQATPVQG